MKGREFLVARRRKVNVGGLYIASGSSIHRREVVDRCRVPTPDGPCGHPLYEDEPRAKLEAHIRTCCAENHDFIMETRQRQHPEALEPWDPELAAWAKKNADRIMRGAKRM